MKRCIAGGALLVLAASTVARAQNSPTENGFNSAPDAWLLVSVGKPWWFHSQPSPVPITLHQRAPSTVEAPLIDRAKRLLANRPARAIALVEGDQVVFRGFNSPANEESTLFGFSMGKTVTSMAVGQAICAGHLKLETQAVELIPEFKDQALGKATVRDLLRMASGAAEPNADSTILTPAEFKEWGRGNLNLLKLVTEDHVAKAGRGIFSAYAPGEHFSYKETDPLTLGLMVARATGMPYAKWLQQQVLDPMGQAQPGLLVQDRSENVPTASAVRLKLEDWIRFALWVKRSSKAPGCFGDYVRSAMSKQIANNGPTPQTRKSGKLFASYGYLTWLDNSIAPHTAWAVGWGGQRIGWDLDSDRMVIAFGNLENWMPELYELSRDWNAAAH